MRCRVVEIVAFTAAGSFVIGVIVGYLLAGFGQD